MCAESYLTSNDPVRMKELLEAQPEAIPIATIIEQIVLAWNQNTPRTGVFRSG